MTGVQQPKADWDQKNFLSVLRGALRAIREPRFYETERGYQGALLIELHNRLSGAEFPGDPIVEQEYQKRLTDHGIRIRPDLIIHLPFERGNTLSRKVGNFVAIEIKLRATKRGAEDDFANLRLLSRKLHYPLIVFINIDSNQTHFREEARASYPGLVCFAVRLAVASGNAASQRDTIATEDVELLET